MMLLSQVVDSLEAASTRAPGATKLYKICKILFKGAKSCIEQNLNGQYLPPNPRLQAIPGNGKIMPDQSQYVLVPNSSQNNQMFTENWDSLQIDSMENMSMLFDNYLAGNSSMMPILEADLTRFETMEFDGAIG
jgi:hypothetical protein